jgi:tRNA nucleotidyltransferase (CCA-adding enzyme)
LKAIHPSLPWNDLIYIDLHEKINKTHYEKLDRKTNLRIQFDRRTFGYLLWLSNLSEVDVIPVCRRLRLPDSIKKNILAIQEISTKLLDLHNYSPSKICIILDGFPLTALYIAFLKTNEDSAKILEKYILLWRLLKPKTTGDDLIKIGLPPGPIYQEILDRLRAAWLDGEINSLEGEKKYVDKIVGNLKSETQ